MAIQRSVTKLSAYKRRRLVTWCGSLGSYFMRSKVNGKVTAAAVGGCLMSRRPLSRRLGAVRRGQKVISRASPVPAPIVLPVK